MRVASRVELKESVMRANELIKEMNEMSKSLNQIENKQNMVDLEEESLQELKNKGDYTKVIR